MTKTGFIYQLYHLKEVIEWEKAIEEQGGESFLEALMVKRGPKRRKRKRYRGIRYQNLSLIILPLYLLLIPYYGLSII